MDSSSDIIDYFNSSKKPDVPHWASLIYILMV